jgi:hypothetical protein
MILAGESVNTRVCRDIINDVEKNGDSGHFPTFNWDRDLEGCTCIIQCGSQSDAGYTPVFNVKWIR